MQARMAVTVALLAMLAFSISYASDAVQCNYGGFDLSVIPQAQLVINQDYNNQPLTPYTWVINLCQAVSSPPDGAGACSDRATGNAVPGFVTEYSSSHCETAWNSRVSAQGGDKTLTMNFAQIDPANHVGWTASVVLNCAGTDPALVSTSNVIVTGTGNLNFAFTFTTSAVCGSGPTPPGPTPIPPTPPGPTPIPPPGPTPNPNPNPAPPQESEPACSGGCAFTIIVFVGGFLYVAGTVAFYFFRQGKRGMELLPHPDFWKDFVSLVRDGVVFSGQKIRALICKSGPYAGDGYQQV